MQTTSSRQSSGPLLLGAVLVIVGLAVVGLQALGIDPIERISQAGWPLFVILPGLALLVAAFVVTPPQGVGFAIPGSIVTTTGLVLLYQDATGHWESWAYAWALVGPAAAGAGLLVYGLVYRHGEFVRLGTRLVAAGAVLFVVGLWFFESLFGSGRLPIDLDLVLPIVLIGLGAVIVLASVVGWPRISGPRHAAATQPGPAAPEPGPTAKEPGVAETKETPQ